MTQVIFQNNETLMQHLYRPGFMFQHLPRIGEEVSIYGDDDETVLEGIVQNVSWGIGRAMENENDYSVFICVDPFPSNTASRPTALAAVQGEGQALPAQRLKHGG
jgi:hypothetical protein